MTTALSVYSTNTNSSTLSTARKLVTGTGAGSTTPITTKCGTSTGYSEIYSQGTTASWAGAAAIGSPSGHGFLLEAATLDLTGQRIIAGNWTPRFRGKISVGTAVVDIYVRAYVYDGSTYTQIGSTMSLLSQTLTTTSTDLTFSSFSQPSQDFKSGQLLYIGCWLNIVTNSSGSSSATISVVEAVSSTQGNGSSFKVDTPGYQPIAIYDWKARARIAQALNWVARARLQESTLVATLGSDNFTRANQSGFGTASDGQPWNTLGGSATLAISSNSGTNTGSTTTTTLALGSKTAADLDQKIKGKVSGVSGGDRLGIAARIQDATTHYRVYWTGGNILVVRDVANVKTTLSTTAFSMTIGNIYWLRVQIYGSNPTTINAKMWADGGSEPGSWTVTTTDTSPLQGAGQHGLGLALGDAANTVTIYSYSASNLTNPHDWTARARLRDPITLDWAARARIGGQAVLYDWKARARLAGPGLKDWSARANIAESALAVPTIASPSFTLTIGGVVQKVKVDTLKLEETIDGRSLLNCTLEDPTGAYHIQHRLPVLLTHSTRGVIYRGFVDKPREENLLPNPNNEIQLVCIDEHYLADKRSYEGDDYANEYAGDIAADFARVLADEGVQATYAIDRDTTQDDFAQGTLSGVVAAANTGSTVTGDGDLELALAGTNLSIVEQTFNDFNSWQLFGVQANDNGDGTGSLSLAATPAIQFKASATIPSGGNLFTYYKVWSGSQLVFSGDALVYDMWVSGDSPEIKAGVDLIFSDGSRLAANTSLFDGQGMPPHPNIDLKGLADNQWYHRRIDLSPYDGKTIIAVNIAFEGDKPGDYAAWFRHILQKDSNNSTVATFFEYTFLLDPPHQIGNNGYTPALIRVVDSYERTGARISLTQPLDSVGIARQSLISWSVDMPKDADNKDISGITFTLETSLDESDTWQLCENFKAIPNILAGAVLSGRTIMFRETMTNTTSDPTRTPFLSNVTASFAPSYAASKLDVYRTYGFNAEFAQGTLTNLIVNLDSIRFNQAVESFDAASTANFSLFGASGPAMSIVNKQLKLQSGNTTDARVRLNAIGSWQDFVCEVDIYVAQTTQSDVGIVYRTTAWQNNNDTYAYVAYVNDSQIVLAKGNNSGSGSGSFTQIATAALSLSSADWHRLKVIVTGNSHNLYLDDVPYISTTDSSYTGAGNIGLRFYNNTGSMSLQAARNSGTAYGNITVNGIFADIANATPITIDSGGNAETVYAYGSASAGTGTQTVSITTNSLGNGANQANWTPAHTHGIGTGCAFAHNESALFDNFGVTTFVQGSWTSPAQDLSSAGIVQDSLIFWDGSFPNSTEIVVEASLDGGNTYLECTNGKAIPGLDHGGSLSGVSLLIAVSLLTPNANIQPFVSGLTFWVVGQLNAVGYRISPPLSLSPVGRVGSSAVNWTANLPSDTTTLGIDISLDGTNWTDVTSSNGKAIPLFEAQPDPWIDDFQSNAGVYSSWAVVTGQSLTGFVATWTLDSANRRVVGVGGQEGLYLYGGLSDFGDGEIVFDSDFCQNGGVFFRVNEVFDTAYELVLTDDSFAGTGGTTGLLRLYKIVSGARTQLGKTCQILFHHGKPTRFKVTVVVNSITVSVDGLPIINIADSLWLAPGSVGLRSSGGTNRYSSLRIQPYGDDLSGESLYVKQRLSTTDPLYTPQLEQLAVSVYSNSIGPGKVIPSTAYSVENGSDTTIAQNLDDLANQSNYWWRIKNGILYFQPRTGIPAPWVLTGDDILATATVAVTRSFDLYRNEHIVLGGTEVVEVPERRFGDGFRTSFDTGYEIDSISSIKINGQSVSFGLQGVDDNKAWYFQKGQAGVTQAADTTPLAVGQQWDIVYQGIRQVKAKARNEGQIALLKALEGTSGVVTVVEKVDGLNMEAAQALAQSRIEQYAKLAIDTEFRTRRPGLEAGQFLPVFLSQHGLINDSFLVTDVTYEPEAKQVASVEEFFTVKATSGPIVGQWEHLYS
jgi:hypothetical protein